MPVAISWHAVAVPVHPVKEVVVLSEELVSVLPALVANTRGRSIGPTKTQIAQMCVRAGLTPPEEAGKEMQVRMVLATAVDEHPKEGDKFVRLFVIPGARHRHPPRRAGGQPAA